MRYYLIINLRKREQKICDLLPHPILHRETSLHIRIADIDESHTRTDPTFPHTPLHSASSHN